MVAQHSVIDSLVTEVGDFLGASFDDLACVQLHASEVVPSEGGRDVSRLVLVLRQPAQTQHLFPRSWTNGSGNGTHITILGSTSTASQFCLLELSTYELFDLGAIVLMVSLRVDLSSTIH